jgi:Fe-Mn family superoxide dismutase
MINQAKSPFILPSLPYVQDALEPFISSRTLSFHHGKHHDAYVKNLNALIANTPLAAMSLEEVILESAGKPEHIAIFNNAAQVWNHTFLWHCMKRGGGGKPAGTLYQAIERDFSSFEEFVETFKKTAAGQFGSGWGWLVWDGSRLKITKTANADLPLVHGEHAILTTDVWEHAYYLDYQNKRPDYLSVFMDKLVNWEFAQSNFDKVVK